MASRVSCSRLFFLVYYLLFLTQYSSCILHETTSQLANHTRSTVVDKSSNVGCIVEERKALLEFKQGLTDPKHVLHSWVGEDCCNWYGIVCNNRTGNVIQLDLSFNQISGPISLSIGRLSHLDTLDLSWNSISGPIPASLGNLSHLEALSLKCNNISGPIPESLGNISHLETLSLSNNSISGRIPISLGSLSQLQYLYLSNNSISGPIPASLGNLSHLNTLYLFINSISGPIPASLGSLSHLETLALSKNSISGSIPESLGSLSQLQGLYLSSNLISGALPTSIGNLSHLKSLVLSENLKMNGTIPETIGQFTELTWLSLRGCSWEGYLSENHFKNLINLVSFELSSQTSNFVFNVSHDWIPIFNITSIEIIDCKLMNTTFPPWLRTQHFLQTVILSNVGISDTIPNWFWRNSKFLKILDLSSNQLQGKLPYSIHSLLSGSLPPSLVLMDLSRNYISGNIPRDWTGFSDLKIIDLSNNNLSGPIPSSLCSQLPSLTWLRLSSNNLSGNLDTSLQNCKLLVGLDLTGNKFFGSLPYLIGENLDSLFYLLLGDNNFSGNIPQQLCGLSYLEVLDFSHNNLSGTIPTCLCNLKEMTEGSGVLCPWTIDLTDYGILPIHIELNLKGVKREYGANFIGLIKTLDLSSNNLRGEIPEKIRNLVALHSLDLSHNQLTGKIPEGIGSLKELEALDLSRNHLWGSIPLSMTDMTFLNKLNLSSNNLSGPIPSANQFNTFNDPTSFEGNSGLCGGPLPTRCGAPPIPDPKVEEEDEEDKYGRLWLYASTAIGFIVGFWVVFGSLVIKRSWRHAYFRFLDKTKGRLYLW